MPNAARSATTFVSVKQLEAQLKLVRIFMYGMFFFYFVCFLSVQMPISEYVKASYSYLFSIAGGASFVISALSLQVLFGFYTDLLGRRK